MKIAELIEYLEGKSNAQTSESIQDWLKNPANDMESRQMLQELWTKSDIRLKSGKPDFNQILQQVHQRISDQQDAQKQIKPKRTQNRIRSFYSVYSRIAAILILPFILVSVYLYFQPQTSFIETAEIQYREIYTKPGTRTKINLPDGTNVWLNDGTSIRYPEKFTGSTREVFVDGEAYFEVKSNPENPFLVVNPMMTTKVTGTHFNLNAYTKDKYFELTLSEGKVSLLKNSQSVDMEPGEQVQFDVSQEKIVKKSVDPGNAAAWIDGRLIFKDEKVGVAIKKIARWYNVEIILTDPDLANYQLTGTFQDEKLDQTLKLISLALPVHFEFKKENNKLKLERTIYMKKI